MRMTDSSSRDLTRNDKGLTSSIHSTVTPRKRYSSTLPRVAKISLRQRARKHSVHQTTNNTRSLTIIHVKTRPSNRSFPGRTNQTVDTFPTVTDLVNTSRRHDLTFATHQKSNQLTNNAAHSAGINNNCSPNQSLSQSHDNLWTNVDQGQTKSSTNHIQKNSETQRKCLSKLSNTMPFNDTISHNSIEFNSSSKTKMADTRSKSLGEFRDILENTKKRKKRRKICCFFVPLLVGLILGILAALLLIFLLKSAAKTPFVCLSYSCVKQSWTSSANLLAKWQFNNNLLEDVTNSTTFAAQTPTYVIGYVNQALFFRINVNQSLTSPIITLTSISFTIDAWIYPVMSSNQQEYSILSLCQRLVNDQCLYLTIHKNGGNYTLYFGFYGDDCQGNAFVLTNEWIHVAFVFDATSLTQSIYINGILDVTRAAVRAFTANPATVTIGDTALLNSAVGSNYFVGVIDQLAISGRAKSHCEILEEATLAAHFTFDTGISFTDSGPNSLSAVGQSVSFVSTGHSRQAISFNGSNSSYFQISDLTALSISDRSFSISFWLRPRSLSGVLVHVSSNSSGLGRCMSFLGFTANGSIFAEIINSAFRSVIGTSISLAPAWTYVVETWSPENGLRLYINNVLVAFTTSMVNSYTASGVPNYITLANSLSGYGVCYGSLLGPMTPFNGDIDEFRVYSRELNADDNCGLYTT